MKKWRHQSCFHIYFLINGLKLSKIVSFWQFFADISKISKAVIAIYVYASEGSLLTLLENGVGYYAMIQSLQEDISV